MGTTALKSGDVIGIAASASPFDREKFEKGLAQLQAWGFSTYHRPDIFTQNRYLAGSEERRLMELEELFEKAEVKAILFARGGFGCQHILPKLNLKKIQRSPKPVVGCSDLTPLLYQLQQAGCPTFYGPVLNQLGGEVDEETKQSLRNTLLGKPTTILANKTVKILKPGKAQGSIAGGCLKLITTSIGTSYEMNIKNKILFLEDTNEPAYAIDRMLTQLKNTGSLKQCKGILFGSLNSPRESEEEMTAILQDVLQDFPGPVLSGIPAGHTNHFITLPLGVECIVDAETQKIIFGQ